MRILITSDGATEEIDSVRSITSHTTEGLGKYIAEIFLEDEHEMILVTTRGAIKLQEQSYLTTYVISNVGSLIETLEPPVKTHDAFIYSMAVSDYTPVCMTGLGEVGDAEHISDLLTQQNIESKISSRADYQVPFLKGIPKVTSLVKTWNPGIVLIGFKLLINISRDELFAAARVSLKKNKVHYIVASDLNEVNGAQHHAYLLSENDVTKAKTKTELAKLIFEGMTNHD